ncbi:MAG: nitrous oxide reductase family maturation protein NosD, partial [Leptospira sp.]|nr:nitrous oxide reductase family maturation protein NosD [Leptospira sp.]
MKLILISILILFFSIPLLSKTIGVCPTCQYNSPADAIKNSDPGDTIEIGPGEYPVGTLTLTKPVSLIAKGKTILDGEKKGHVIDIRSNGVSVTGFEIKNSGVSDLLEFAAIHTEKVKKCEILNNTLYDTTYGIYLAETSDCIVSGNSSDGNAKNEVSGGNGI